MKDQKILKIDIPNLSQKQTLEKIEKYAVAGQEFVQIVSLNPEILVIAQKNVEFNMALQEAPIKIIDGVGVYLAAKWLKIPIQERFTGVQLMEEVVKIADTNRLRVLFVGGKPKLAAELAVCYARAYLKAEFKGVEAISDIKNPQKSEETELFSIVRIYRPHFIIASFGSPWQELWFERHKDELKGIVCMGVGGAFDFAAGTVKRAPKWVQAIGLEWLFRLMVEPWRWRRQLRLLQFIYLVIKQKFGFYD